MVCELLVTYGIFLVAVFTGDTLERKNSLPTKPCGWTPLSVYAKVIVTRIRIAHCSIYMYTTLQNSENLIARCARDIEVT